VNNKIKNIEELSKILEEEKAKGKKIIHCHGVFDLLHIGHIRYFKQAKQMGDILIVTITADEFVDKGPHRPAFTETLRLEAVASLSDIDYVAVNPWPTAENTLKLLKPDVYVKGSEFKNTDSDMTGKIQKEEKIVSDIGSKIAFTEDIVFSSTNLINKYISSLSDELNDYLNIFRKRYSLDDIFNLIEKIASLKVLVIGDTIIDEYQYGETIGKSSKDPTLALKYESRDIFAGGILAIANHVANFVNTVKLVTIIGDKNSYSQFIDEQLNPKIDPYFIIKKDSPTTLKKRFIDYYAFTKLLEVYIMDDSYLSENEDIKLCNWLKQEIKKYDLVITADFGHGAISDKVVKLLCENSKFFALNTQANAGNRGFHTVSRYPSADFICIAEHEMRLELRDTKSDLKKLLQKIHKNIKFDKMVVTSGKKGCIVYHKDKEYIQVPSFAQNVIDRVGAGDAFFSIASLMAAIGENNEFIGFIGNVVGALAVEVLGNKKPIDKLSVKKYIMSLMK